MKIKLKSMQNRSFVFYMLCLVATLALPGGAAAQSTLVPDSFRNFELGKGDTMIFRYAQGSVSQDASVVPVTMYEFKAKKGDINCYYEGFLWYHPRGQQTNPHWVYHSDFPDSREGTPVYAIRDVPMVLVDIQRADKRVGNPFDILLRNTRYNDTIRFRKYRSSEVKLLPDTVIVPRLERQLKSRLQGGYYYYEVNAGDFVEGDLAVKNSQGETRNYRPCRVVGCYAYYLMKGMWVPNFGDLASWTASYHTTATEPVVHVYLEDAAGNRIDAYDTPVYTWNELQN